MKAPKYVLPNDPTMAGHQAAIAIKFGERDRYTIFPIHTRFGKVEWIVTDSEKIDPVLGLPEIIRQCDDEDEAFLGLV